MKVHIVWSPATGPIAAYLDAFHDRDGHSRALSLATRHAKTMLGVEVKSMGISTQLPPIALDDLTTDFDDPDDTPVIDFRDIDDSPKGSK